MSQYIESEATILDVKDDAKWKYSIEAEIPAFDGDRSYRFLVWNKRQGPPPQVGATGRGTFEPYQRAKFYVERGDIEAGPVDGTEMTYMVTWNMVGFVAGAANGAGATHSTSPAPSNAVRATSNAPATSGTTYLPAPTAEEKLAKEITKYRREVEGINDRKAISDILAMVAPGTYVLDGLIEDAEKLAAWYNTRMAARCESPLIQTAQAAGAVVTKVEDKLTDGPPPLKNKAELAKWVEGQQWSKNDVSGVLQDAGFASSNAYLQESGNTVQGLAELLHEKLNW